ncbi:MAG: amidohydrolase family protein [Chloroflexi bacterium]|nr:amidohydrolase family protein [Chloroflexota bacterium]
MAVIDADTHVDESESTWEWLEGALARYTPTTMMPPIEAIEHAGMDAHRSRFWFVEGRLQTRAVRDDEHHPAQARRELDDLEGRLEDMDRMGVDVQVIFPTFFIRYIALNPEPEAALASAYNRWVAEKCGQTGGRIRWAAVLPWLDPDASVRELRWAKENGACGIFKRGLDLLKPVGDRHFFPVYEAANDLDMPLCIHTGHPGSGGDRGFPIMDAFLSVVRSKLPSRFPNLRFGFIEAGASWIPYVLSQIAMVERSDTLHERRVALETSRNLFRDNRLYVSIDPVDDVEYLLTLGTEDNLMIGTDYSHSDISANISALGEVRRWADSGMISNEAAGKILEENPMRFYGL